MTPSRSSLPTGNPVRSPARLNRLSPIQKKRPTPLSTEAHKWLKTIGFREPYLKSGVHRFGEKRSSNRAVLACRESRGQIRNDHGYWAYDPASSPREYTALSKLAEREELRSNLLQYVSSRKQSSGWHP